MAFEVYNDTNKVKEIVKKTMETREATRNNDNILLRTVWERYGEDIPAATITRVRREIQNDEHELIPTDPNVIRKRFKKQKEFKERALQRLGMKYPNEVYDIK